MLANHEPYILPTFYLKVLILRGSARGSTVCNLVPSVSIILHCHQLCLPTRARNHLEAGLLLRKSQHLYGCYMYLVKDYTNGHKQDEPVFKLQVVSNSINAYSASALLIVHIKLRLSRSVTTIVSQTVRGLFLS